MCFKREGQSYDRAEMISYHTTDPAVPTVFQSLRDGAVFLRIDSGRIEPVEDHEIATIADRYSVPELVRMARVAG